ncbi:MAG: patatin-like phospholipase family protein [Myxococcota bacterium]
MPRPPTPPRDVALTFAGGGNRSFYQLGLLRQWGERLRPRIGAIAACSAGACVATVWLSGRQTQTHRFWKARRQGVTRNFDLARLLRGQRPTPHGPIYRDTLLCAFAEDGLDKIRAAPFPVLVITARPPRLLPTEVSAVLGFLAYNLEQQVRRDFVHPELGQRLGFRAHLVDARRCRSAEELADLIIASSSTPPFTPVGRFGGRRLLDGGLVDVAPASAAEQVRGIRRNLVLLARPYPASCVGQQGSRLYVAPTRQPPVDLWDYTQPERIDETIEMGEREATLYDRELRRFLVR